MTDPVLVEISGGVLVYVSLGEDPTTNILAGPWTTTHLDDVDLANLRVRLVGALRKVEKELHVRGLLQPLTTPEGGVG